MFWCVVWCLLCLFSLGCLLVLLVVALFVIKLSVCLLLCVVSALVAESVSLVDAVLGRNNFGYQNRWLFCLKNILLEAWSALRKACHAWFLLLFCVLVCLLCFGEDTVKNILLVLLFRLGLVLLLAIKWCCLLFALKRVCSLSKLPL